jgi:hypothetical protein
MPFYDETIQTLNYSSEILHLLADNYTQSNCNAVQMYSSGAKALSSKQTLSSGHYHC